MSNNGNERSVVFTDPYMDPRNIHRDESGKLVAYGPHGIQFNVIGIHEVVAESIRHGQFPDLATRLQSWQKDHIGPEVWSAEDSCA